MTRKPSLLFVDDEERIVRLLNMMFRNNYEVFTATSGAEALKIVDANRIDVVVSDQRMPEMVGITLLGLIRERSPNTTRILLTGYSDLVAIIGAVNEGEVFRFINKPWNQEELRAVMAEAATRAQLAFEQKTPGEISERRADEQPLATAAKLLAVDGVDGDRVEVVEMFTRDYHVLTATNIEDALDYIADHDVGVIVIDTESAGANIIDMLAKINELNPTITTVAITALPESDTIIRLINQARIFRFAMKPLSPNIFRLAVAAAMREHHRRLADLRFAPAARQEPQAAEMAKSGQGMFDSIVQSLSRFTRTRPG